MTFTTSQKTLERLEWPQVLSLLREVARTPRGRSRLGGTGDPGAEGDPLAMWLFQGSREEVVARLTETTEARAILHAGDRPPLEGIFDLAEALDRARKGGVLRERELLDLRSSTLAFRATARFLHLRRELAPTLADRTEAIADFSALEFDIDSALTPSGEVRDDASEALAEARLATRRLEADIQRSLSRFLRDPNVTARLSDHYFTVRNDRYVLPVRADSRGGFRGIVHDVSGSGATLFIEPEQLVDLNNQNRQAEFAALRETQRILRELSANAALAAEDVEAAHECIAAIDLSFARAHLALQMNATAPDVRHEGVLDLPQLRHPLLPEEAAVANDVQLGSTYRVLVLSGPNAGGKTVTMKSAALAALFARAGLHVPASTGARVDLFDSIHADIGDDQDIRESLSTFSAHVANLAHIVDHADRHSLVVLDEIGVGTDPGEGAALAQAVLEALADSDSRVIVTTHYNLLKEMAEVDPRFANASLEFDERTLEPTYRLCLGRAGVSSATAVAARVGLRVDVVERAEALLEREDRQLERMLKDLSVSRAALEREQREASRIRAESEATRSEYRTKLETLQNRRDKLFRDLRADLDRGFRNAHDEIASVIRELQRRGTARDAAQARERLLELNARVERVAEEAGFAGATEAVGPEVDWSSARPGDPVQISGGGEAVLLTLPDRRGKVAIRQGSARIVVPADRVTAVPSSERDAERTQPAKSHVSLQQTGIEASPDPPTDPFRSDDSTRCDLRGLRVDEALDALDEALDRATSANRNDLLIVHGIGTGALRRAVRKHLRASPYIADFIDAKPGEGGDGATLARLRN